MDLILKIFVVIISVIVILSLLAFAAAAATGRVDRAYAVLDPSADIQVGSETLSVEELASRYQPITRLGYANPSPPLLQTDYEVVDNADTWDIDYYNVWEDEINPIPLIHQIYRFFRSAYYGSPVRDIEYIQINISKVDGTISMVQFETSPGTNYSVVISVHLVARYIRTDGDKFNVIITDKDSGGQVDTQEGVVPWFEGSHLVIEVATWNHLSRLATQDIASSSTRLQPPLHFLTNEEYRSMKFVRKSQGDHQTVESPVGRAIGVGAMMVFAAVSGYWIAARLSKKKRG